MLLPSSPRENYKSEAIAVLVRKAFRAEKKRKIPNGSTTGTTVPR